MRKPIIRLTVAVASAAALGACSSPSHAASNPTTTATTAPAATTTTAVAATTTTVAAAPADPHSLLMQLTDLPASVWKAQPHPADPTRRADDASLDDCLGIPVIDDNESAVYYSDFVRSDNQSFGDGEVDVVKSAAYASRDFAALRGPKSIDCAVSTSKVIFARLNKTSANKFSDPTASFIPAPAPFFGIRVNSTLTLANGTADPVSTDTFYLQRGNDEAQYDFSAVGGPDTNTETTVLANVAKRTQA